MNLPVLPPEFRLERSLQDHGASISAWLQRAFEDTNPLLAEMDVQDFRFIGGLAVRLERVLSKAGHGNELRLDPYTVASQGVRLAKQAERVIRTETETAHWLQQRLVGPVSDIDQLVTEAASDLADFSRERPRTIRLAVDLPAYMPELEPDAAMPASWQARLTYQRLQVGRVAALSFLALETWQASLLEGMRRRDSFLQDFPELADFALQVDHYLPPTGDQL